MRSAGSAARVPRTSPAPIAQVAPRRRAVAFLPGVPKSAPPAARVVLIPTMMAARPNLSWPSPRRARVARSVALPSHPPRPPELTRAPDFPAFVDEMSAFLFAR